MAHLLHIDSSSLSVGSVSKEIATTFRKAWQEVRPDDIVVHRDLGLDPVPPLSEAGITAAFTPAEGRTPAQAEAFALRDRLVQEVVDADAYLFSVPMYNWGVPAAFKAWLDQVILAGRTLPAAGLAPLTGRPAVVVLSYGGGYDPGSSRESWDFVQPYLRTALGMALGLDVTFVKTQLTMAEHNPAMADLVPVAQQLRGIAHTNAGNQARRIAASLAV